MRYISDSKADHPLVYRLVSEPDELRSLYLQIVMPGCGVLILLIACLANPALFLHVVIPLALCAVFVVYGFIVTIKRNARELLVSPECLIAIRPLIATEERLFWNDVKQVSVWRINENFCLSIRSYYGVRIDLYSARAPHEEIIEFLKDICVRSHIPIDDDKLKEADGRICVFKPESPLSNANR